jgi:RNA polymerase-binding transcription factor DksA
MRSTSVPQLTGRHDGAVRPRVHTAVHAGAVQGAIHAGPGAIHAGPGGLARRRAELEARWRDRLERVTELSLAFHDEAERSRVRPAVGGSGRSGSDQRMSRRVHLLARQAVAERQALAEIEAALERIATGQYGWCEQCGRPIGAGLLAAAPQTRYCAACARRGAQRMAYA